jgi:glycosyltransferase involved in cell wall biosynthesis
LGLDERVRFLGWRHDRASLLEKASVCTLPSRYEPFGTVIAESWFSGVPLVAAKAAGANQYVTHEFDGLLCEIDDVDGLAEQLRRALQDHDLRTRLIENGKTTYQTLFSRNVVIKSLIEAYEKIIALGKK